MNAIWLLLGLLVLAYTGSMLVGGRAIRGYGLPSGVEYVLLGFVLGPHVLDVAQRDVVSAFEPLLVVALGWLALVVGVDYGVVGDRRVATKPLLGGMLLSALSGAGVFAAVYFAGRRFTDLSPLDLALVAGGTAIALAETTRHAVRWVVERYAADGPLSRLLADISDADDAVPILALAALFALGPSDLPWGLGMRVAVTLGSGVLLGLTTALLLGKEFRFNESWGLVIGTALLGIGLATRLDLSPLSVMFALGVTLVVISPHRRDIRLMIAETERPVLLPVLLLAGAIIDLGASKHTALIVGVALLARLGVKLLGGFGLYALNKSARRAGPWVGFGTLSSGAVAISIGVLCWARFPGEVGSLVLAAATASALFGEILGPTSLRRALTRAGEIQPSTKPESGEPATRTPAPASTGSDP